MKLKKFNELNNNNDIDPFNEENWDETDNIDPMLASKILINLKNGFAVKIFKDSFEKFCDMIDKYGQGIEFERNMEIPESLYFVLIGKRLFNTHKPSFGGQKFEIYIPSI